MFKKSLLLHCCCGPCSIHVIDLLKNDYKITLYFYNPNIYPETEYIKRKKVLEDYARQIGIPFIDEDYIADEFYQKIDGLQSEPEGGKRCLLCFGFRLQKTAAKAKELGIENFTTTLTISPHKNSKAVFTEAKKAEEESGIQFLEENFKKKDGFKWAMQKSREAGFYLQNYCGCEFSLKESEERMKRKKEKS